LALSQIENVLSELSAEGLLRENEDLIQPSAFGRQFIDDMAQKFLP